MVRHADSVAGLRSLLIDVGASAVRSGLVLASGGNLSARLPGAGEFVVTGAGTWLDRLTHDDFSRLRLDDGTRVDRAERPSTEWKLHQRTYAARPDVNAIVHLHPQHTVLVDALGEEIRLVTLDHAVYVRAVGRVPYLPTGSDELAEAAAGQAAAGYDAMVLAHHGCSALGVDVGMAYRRAANLEEAAVASYRLLLLGDRSLRFPGDRSGGAPGHA